MRKLQINSFNSIDFGFKVVMNRIILVAMTVLYSLSSIASHQTYQSDRTASLNAASNKKIYRSDTVIYQSHKKRVYYDQTYGGVDQVFYSNPNKNRVKQNFNYNVFVDPSQKNGWRKRRPYRPFPGILPPIFPPPVK